jgi:hypothetical protein
MEPRCILLTGSGLVCLGLATVLAGCGSGFNRLSMERSMRERAPMFDDADVEAIERLHPQVELPVRIAVSQPLSGGAWTAAEIDEISTWEKPLKRAGIARRVVVLPESLLRDSALDSQRKAAARVGADTLLVMNPETRVDAYVNALAPLDLTIVGLWLVPAHHRDSMTLLEGALIDNRNQYLYAFARGEGADKSMRPLAYVSQSPVEAKSRLAALRDFGQRLVTEMNGDGE